MPSKVHVPTAVTRGKVEALAAYGIIEEAIAYEVGISPPTLRKYYADELKFGTQRLIAKVANRLYEAATVAPWLRNRLGEIVMDESGSRIRDIWHGGHLGAKYFILKTRGRWRETSDVNLSIDVDDGSDAREKLARGLARLATAGTAGETSEGADA